MKPYYEDATVGDRCSTCGAELKTLRNCVDRGDEVGLAATWMPPGGCACSGVLDADANPDCRRCFPPKPLCVSCGAPDAELQMTLSFDGAA